MDVVKEGDAGGSAAVVSDDGGADPNPNPTPEQPPAGEDGTPPAAASKVKLPASIKPPVKTGRFQARISDLVGQRDSATRENLQLREQLSKMQAMPKGTKDGVAPDRKEASTPGVLNPEDFDTYAEYITALVNDISDKKANSEKSKQAHDNYEKHKSDRMTSFNEQAGPLATEYGDGFWDAITDPNLPITEAMADAVLELDDLGPYTMLYLAAHKDEAAKIAKMNPRAATIAIGRLAMKLDFEIKQGGEGAGAAAATEGGDVNAPAGTPAAGSSTPAAPKPSPVPTPRGSSPTALDSSPTDKDDVKTWLQKETNRLRRINPNGRFYGAS